MKISEKTMIIIQEEQKCTGCRACMKGCPMLKEFCDSPKDLLKELEESGEFGYKLPYSCMLCGYCTKVCPEGVDLKSLFLELRRDTVRETRGRLPKELNTQAVDFHQRFSFSKLFTGNIQNLSSDTVFFPGCALISNSPKIVYNTYEYLCEKLPGIGYYNKCCGKPTAFMGKEEKFREYYSDLEGEFTKGGVKRIITSCQNCYMTLNQNSPDIEVLSLWDVIAKEGLPEVSVAFEKGVTIHDPCPTRNVSSIHDSVRKIVRGLGIELEEMENSRGKTLCCGSGGMVSVTQGHIAKSHMERRAGEAKTDYVVTYCQECVESMRRGGKKAYHILDLLFNGEYKNMNQENHTTLKKWLNRYRGKKLRR